MKKRGQNQRMELIPYAFLLPFVIWFALLIAPPLQEGKSLRGALPLLAEALQQPFHISFAENSAKVTTLLCGAYSLAVACYVLDKRETRNGEEHGSAKWGDVRALNKKYYTTADPAENLIMTQHFGMGLDGHKTLRNLNVIIIGGSGSGKTRFYAKPNLMQANTSFIITDPKGELLRATGALLQKLGYEIRVFDLIHPEHSMCYNPFCYIHEDNDVLKLITNYVRNTTPKNATGGDPFWEKSETELLMCLMLYLVHYAPSYEQNFSMILEMMRNMQVQENGDDCMNPVDILFGELQDEAPDSIAAKMYADFKLSPAKTTKSILISAGVRMKEFNLPQIARITARDEMDFRSIGQRKVALFCVTPDIDKTYNFLISMLYTQAFQELEILADEQPDGRLPVHVHCIMDEFANIALPDSFENVLATARSREISVSIILQNLAQLKALFEKHWESIVGNCDQLLYLGGNEQGTHKYISELIGKQTIETKTYGQTKGRQGSYSTNRQQTGRDLMTPDEVRLLDNRDAILFVRGERPILDAKYDILSHPRIKETADGGSEPFSYRHSLARLYTNTENPDAVMILDSDEIDLTTEKTEENENEKRKDA